MGMLDKEASDVWQGSVSDAACPGWVVSSDLWNLPWQYSSKGRRATHRTCLCHWEPLCDVSTWTDDPGLVSSCYTAAKLMSMAQHYHVCDNLTICLWARHNKHRIVSRLMSPSCALCQGKYWAHISPEALLYLTLYRGLYFALIILNLKPQVRNSSYILWKYTRIGMLTWSNQSEGHVTGCCALGDVSVFKWNLR